MDFSELRPHLDEMGLDELKRVYAYVGLKLKSKTGKRASSLDLERQFYYGMLIDALQRRHWRNIPEHEAKTFRPTISGFDANKFEQAYQACRDYMDANGLGNLKQNERIYFYGLVTRSGVSYIDRLGERLGIKNLLEKLQDVGVLLENQLPGYAQSNILPILIKHAADVVIKPV